VQKHVQFTAKAKKNSKIKNQNKIRPFLTIFRFFQTFVW